MIWWTAVKILFGKFAEGFLVGIILRTLISMIFKMEMTVGGLLRSATIVGLIVMGLWIYVALKLFG